MSNLNSQEQNVLSSIEINSIQPKKIEASSTPLAGSDKTSKLSRKLRNTLIGIGSIGLVASSLVPELKLSESGLLTNFDNLANAAVTVDSKKVIVTENDIKNGLAFTDQDFTKHEPTKDFLTKYKNISDESINALVKSMVPEQKLQQVSTLLKPPVSFEDKMKVLELTQEIVTQLNNPKKTFNINSKIAGSRIAEVKEATPPTTGEIISTAPKGSFIKPVVSPVPEATETPSSKPEQTATPESTKPTKIDKPKDDMLERAAIGGLIGLTLATGAGVAGVLGYKKFMNRADEEEIERGFDFNTNTRYPKISRFEALKNKLLKRRIPEGPTREDFEEMDDEDFEDIVINADNKRDSIGFGSSADKKFKLHFIFTKTDLVLSTEIKSYLYQLLQNIDLNMFSSSEKLTFHIKKELNWTSYEIPLEDLLTISEILLDKNLN